MIEMKVSYDTDKTAGAGEHAALGGAGAHARAEGQHRGPARDGAPGREMPIEQAASRWIVSDDPDEQVEKIKPYIDLGFTHLVFHAPGLDQVRFIELYGTGRAAEAARPRRIVVPHPPAPSPACGRRRADRCWAPILRRLPDSTSRRQVGWPS